MKPAEKADLPAASAEVKEATASTPVVEQPDEEKKQTQQNTYLSQGAEDVSKPPTVEQPKAEESPAQAAAPASSAPAPQKAKGAKRVYEK